MQDLAVETGGGCCRKVELRAFTEHRRGFAVGVVIGGSCLPQKPRRALTVKAEDSPEAVDVPIAARCCLAESRKCGLCWVSDRSG